MRNEVTSITINRESIEMYAEITKIVGESANYLNESGECHWDLLEGLYISLEMVDGEAYPIVTIKDGFDNFDKIYQIIGYAHYRGYQVICNF